MSRPDFGNQEYLFTPTRNDMTDQFLRVAVSINLRRINQRHSQRNAFAQRVFLDRFRMSALAQTRRTLTERWDDGSVVEFHGSPRRIWSRARPEPLPLMARQPLLQRSAQPSRMSKSIQLAHVDLVSLIFSGTRRAADRACRKRREPAADRSQQFARLLALCPGCARAARDSFNCEYQRRKNCRSFQVSHCRSPRRRQQCH